MDDDEDSRLERMMIVPEEFYSQMLKDHAALLAGQTALMKDASHLPNASVAQQFLSRDSEKRRLESVATDLTRTLNAPELTAEQSRAIGPLLDEVTSRKRLAGQVKPTAVGELVKLLQKAAAAETVAKPAAPNKSISKTAAPKAGQSEEKPPPGTKARRRKGAKAVRITPKRAAKEDPVWTSRLWSS